MTRVLSALVSLALVSGCAWSQNDKNQRLIDAAKQAKVTLADAAQKAGAAIGGTVVSASLETPREKGAKLVYAVLALCEGKLVAVDVDAQSGEVGKPKSVPAKTNDAHDDDEHEKGEAKATSMSSLKLDFEDTPVGALPKGFAVTETNGAGTPAIWRVEQAKDARSGTHVLSLAETKNGGETFNILLSEAVFPADAELSVQLKANTGSEDQGGGLVWRAKDGGNYYLARWNPLEDNLRCYKVVNHRRSMFKSIDIKTDARAWHRLDVKMRGKSCEIAFDGKPMLAFEDDEFPGPGKAGLWTKADAASSFDALVVTGLK